MNPRAERMNKRRRRRVIGRGDERGLELPCHTFILCSSTFIADVALSAPK